MPTPQGRIDEVIRKTQESPPHEATHWTARAMAKTMGLGVVTVQRIWKAHGLSPHRWRQFKLSTDPAFAEKLRDVVGLYVSPPAYAVVLSVEGMSRSMLKSATGGAADFRITRHLPPGQRRLRVWSDASPVPP
jgi:hypothetical protein